MRHGREGRHAWRQSRTIRPTSQARLTRISVEPSLDSVVEVRRTLSPNSSHPQPVWKSPRPRWGPRVGGRLRCAQSYPHCQEIIDVQSLLVHGFASFRRPRPARRSAPGRRCGAGLRKPKIVATSVTDPPAVEVIHRRSGQSLAGVGQPSFVESYERTSIYPKVTGFIEKWNVDIGDKVKKGQVLATLFVPELRRTGRRRSAPSSSIRNGSIWPSS